jgi:hypothetical protein
VHREPRPEWVPAVERSGREEQWALLCLLAGREVEIDPDELNGAIRRAELLLATGGDPRRGPDLRGRAATSVAADLDRPHRRAALRTGLRRLTSETGGHAVVDEALHVLLDDDDLAWLAYATSLLADHLGDGGE